MKPNWLIVIIALLAGLGIGYRLWHQDAPTEQTIDTVGTADPIKVEPRGMWPDVPSPPGDPQTAREKLMSIIELANAAQKWQIVIKAQECMWGHPGLVSHRGQAANEIAMKVATAHTAAQQGNWGDCARELDHEQ